MLHAAQLAACEAVRPGVTAESVDAAARDVITEAGFGEPSSTAPGTASAWRPTRTPTSSRATTEPLEPGMAFSIEPGIYLPGRHGARIEDIVVCTDERQRAAQHHRPRLRDAGGLMPADRNPADRRGQALLELTREIGREELAPMAAAYEAESRFPREVFRTLGKAGLLGLPYAEEYGGGGQPYEVYLQVVEELATVWAIGRRGRQRAHALLLPAGRVRHRRAAPAVAAGHGRRRAARRLLPVRAAVGLGRRRAAHAGPSATATTTSWTARRRGSPTAARPTSTT